jgi:hypothetical protein
MSLNERFAAEGGFVGLFDWILNIDRNQKWPTFLGREVLDSQMTFDEALVALSKPTILAPIYYIVGGPGQREVNRKFRNT